jgi:hypothetical protein
LTTGVTGLLGVLNGGTGVTTFTGTGDNVLSTAPSITSATLITPALGTPTSGNLANCLGYQAPNISGTLAVGNGGTGTATAFTSGSVVFAGASGVYNQNNSNLFWDNTNTRLGIGTASPSYSLHVAGQTFSSGSASVGDANFYQVLSSGTPIISFDSNDYLSYNRTTNQLTFTSGAVNRFSVDSTGNFAFNSGYGTAATAYGCRAWVNFNGTGTVAIRASGNVSSITDNGTGDYTVNFTSAMPDANFSTTALGSPSSDGDTSSLRGVMLYGPSANTTSGTRLLFENGINTTLYDPAVANVAVFR